VTDDSRVEQLLEELLDSQATPEEVCSSCPELLPLVRERWLAMRRAQAKLDALFPPMTEPDPRAAPAPSGTMSLPVIPGYEVEAVLGLGGMGVVFKARHLKLNRIIALKMALAGAYAGAAERERFQREAEAVAALRHPNIVQIHDVGESDGRPYFTMEYVEGGSLAQKLAGTPQPAREAATLVATLAGAVQAAHESGIIHRDLKPGNVLLTAEGTPKVTDFGLARRLGGEAGLTQSGIAVGTPSYMAPEQARGRADGVGPATDIYALGAILYELLTGRPPFRAETAAETVLQVIHSEPVPPRQLNPSVPRDLETVCLKCLHKEPHRRYSSAAALAEDLQRYLLGQAVAARPVGRLERAWKWIRRNKWIATLSAAAVLTLLAGTVVSLLFALEARRQAVAATENAQRARENEEELRRVLLTRLMIPIEGNDHALNSLLDNTEVVGLCQLRKVPREVRMQFLETALRDPEMARRIGRRADWVIQAIVGCNRALRDEVGQLLVRQIQNPATPQEAKLACARLGQAANLDDRGWAESAAETLRAVLSEKGLDHADYPALAESLAGVIEHLPRAQAAEHAARLTDIFLRGVQEPAGLYLGISHFGAAIKVLSPYLATATANRRAETINATLRDPKCSPYLWVPIAKAQVAVCQALPPPAAAAYVNGMAEIILELHKATKESDKFHYTFQAEMWGILASQLDANAAAQAADTIVATLDDFYRSGPLRSEFIDNLSLPGHLARVAERLDAPGSLRAAEALIPLLKKAGKVVTMEPLRTALVGMCRRLDADGARRVADAIAVTIQDPETPSRARTVLASAFAVVADKLEPDKAAPLESTIVDAVVVDLPDAYFATAVLQTQALASVCGRPGTKSAPRAAEILLAAIRNPQTHPALLKPLAAALAAANDQLPPEQASSQASKATEVLGSFWSARTKPFDRASVALAMAEVWTRLSPLERAAHAKRMAVDLGDALRDTTVTPHECNSLVDALTAVCSQLDPAEREARLSGAEDSLVVRFRNPGNSGPTNVTLTAALATLWSRLDRNRLPRVVDTLCTALSDPDVPRYKLELHAELVKKVVARMEKRDLERLLDQPLTASHVQRAILDALGESKKRTFRNTWDYLDWPGSKGN
jgi:tRNA A-37 threonylcarbamoyl transferase component Bud32